MPRGPSGGGLAAETPPFAPPRPDSCRHEVSAAFQGARLMHGRSRGPHLGELRVRLFLDHVARMVAAVGRGELVLRLVIAVYNFSAHGHPLYLHVYRAVFIDERDADPIPKVAVVALG